MAILSGDHVRLRGVFLAAAMVWSIIVGASPATAQQCPNSATNCNVSSGTLVINTSPNTYAGTTNISSGATLDIVSGGALNGNGVLISNGTLSIGANGTGTFSQGANFGTVAAPAASPSAAPARRSV